MVFTDPTGHSLWSRIKREIRRIGRQIRNNPVVRVIVGFALVIGGVILAPVTGGASLVTAAQGAVALGLISGGGSLINYDPNRPESAGNQLGFTTSVTVPIGGGSSTADEQAQVTHLQEQSATIDRANAGVQTTSAAPVTNDGYANGAATSSYGNNGVSANSDGARAIPVLRVSASGDHDGISYETPETSQRTYNAVGSVKLNRERQALLTGARDGHLTLDEANAWYQNRNGQSLMVDGTRLSYVRSGPTNEYGRYSATIQGTNDYLVHGQVTIRESNGHIYDGKYNFEMHYTPRDIPTLIGRVYAGNGTPFYINYRYEDEWKNQ